MIIYALADPRTREVRYIGETIRTLVQRLSQHKRAAREKTTPPVNAWIRSIQSPLMIEIESLDSVEGMHAAEVFWIDQFRFMGARLLNVAPGGSTRTGYRHSEETKARWRKDRRGDRAGNYGNTHTAETRAELRRIATDHIAAHGHSCTGRVLSDETKRRISAARKGVSINFSDAGRETLSSSARKRWDDPKYRAAMTRPGLLNPWAKKVVLDGEVLCVQEIAYRLGVSRSTAQRRIAAANGREMTARDFAPLRRKAELKECLK